MDTESDTGSRGYNGLWKASPSRQRRRDRRAAERAADAVPAEKASNAKKVAAEKATVYKRATAEKAAIEKTAEQESGVAKTSEKEEAAITSTKPAQTQVLEKKPTRLCPYCSSSYEGVISYSERCLCMDTRDAGCDCTCACDKEQMAFKAICFPTSHWWTVQPPDERQRLLAKAAICINAYYKYED